MSKVIQQRSGRAKNQTQVVWQQNLILSYASFPQKLGVDYFPGV